MIRLRTLGALDLTLPDGSEVRAVLSQPRRMALLTYLAVATPRGFHRRDHLLTLFWADDDLERARASLNRAVYFLRRELGDGVILSRGADEIGLSFERIWCDVAAFDDALERTDLNAALELYRGDLLPGFFASRAAGFENWLETTRARVRERAASASWGVAADSEARGERMLAALAARRAIDLAPFDEVGVRRLLALLDRVGDRAGAARAYQEFADRLATDLELTPSPETEALIKDIRARDHPNGGNNVLAEPIRAPSRAVETEGFPESVASTASTTPVHRLQQRNWATAGAIALSAMMALAFTLATLMRTRTDPRAVYVAPFSNRTADRNLDALGQVAVDRVTQSLSSTGIVEVLPPDERVVVRATTGDSTTPTNVRELAASSHAGTIVGGEFHLESGRLVFQVWIANALRNRVVWAIRPTSVPIDSADRAIEEVSRRVTGAVAALRNPTFASWFPTASVPPTFEAFQEFAEATELQSRGLDSNAIPHLQRAIAVDTSFIWARMQLATAYLNLFHEPTADSIAQELNRARERLNPLQRHWLAWMLSYRKDNVAGYRAIRAAAELAPERFGYSVAQWAVYLNRPREAISVLEALAPDSPHAGGPGAYWNLLTRCYHDVGDGDRELRAARAARRSTVEPMNALSMEIRALAALGRTAEVLALLDSALAIPMEQGPTKLQVMVGVARISSPGQLMVAAAMELRAHGHEAAAQESLARALAWYRSRPAHASDDYELRFQIANTLYLARDWADADTAFHTLAAVDTANSYIHLGFIGTVAARRRDEVTARRIIAKFDTLRATLPVPRAIAGYWQSKISSILGDDQAALTFMIDVWGQQGIHGVHADFDYERMWNAQGFRRFISPKG